MPVKGCSGGCWPFELIVKGVGFNTQAATWPDFQGNLDFTDYKCVLYAGNDVVISSTVFVQDTNTIFCKIGHPHTPPVVTSQPFKVNVTQNGRISDWLPNQNEAIFLTDAWTSTDCSLDAICEGYASGSNNAIKVRGFGFQSDATYTCNFWRGSNAANSTARWTNPKLLECIVPIWNFHEGVVKFEIRKHGIGVLAFEGPGEVGVSGFAHEFRFIAAWWFPWFQNGSVAGHITLTPAVFPGLDPGSPLLTVHGRGFDTSLTYVARVKGPSNVTTPDVTSLTSAYLAKSLLQENCTHQQLVLRVPQYLAYETVVSVDIFKCQDFGPGNAIVCTKVTREGGTGLAFLAYFTNQTSPIVIKEYQYIATVAEMTMDKISDMEGPFTCYPSGSHLCWASSAGGDFLRFRGLGLVVHKAHVYRCRFLSDGGETFS